MVSLYKINFQGEKGYFCFKKRKNSLQGLPAFISCEGFENVEVLCFPKDQILKVMKEDFELTKGILNSLSLKIRRLYRQLKNISNFIRADKRIVTKL